MWHKLRSTISPENPWVAQDRVEMRKLVVTATVFLIAALAGLAWLTYALIA